MSQMPIFSVLAGVVVGAVVFALVVSSALDAYRDYRAPSQRVRRYELRQRRQVLHDRAVMGRSAAELRREWMTRMKEW